ncbi:hypothetical protein NC651_013396 [Populus alba x Populus x berolinensis]|nr:hypothetical protein NC651_013396 [Populus alba x Populus x berolinensis]
MTFTTFFMKLHLAKSAIEVIKFFSMVQDLNVAVLLKICGIIFPLIDLKRKAVVLFEAFSGIMYHVQSFYMSVIVFLSFHVCQVGLDRSAIFILISDLIVEVQHRDFTIRRSSVSKALILKGYIQLVYEQQMIRDFI